MKTSFYVGVFNHGDDGSTLPGRLFITQRRYGHQLADHFADDDRVAWACTPLRRGKRRSNLVHPWSS